MRYTSITHINSPGNGYNVQSDWDTAKDWRVMVLKGNDIAWSHFISATSGKIEITFFPGDNAKTFTEMCLYFDIGKPVPLPVAKPKESELSVDEIRFIEMAKKFLGVNVDRWCSELSVSLTIDSRSISESKADIGEQND